MLQDTQSQKTVPAVLDGKIQFLYEFAFAQRELEGLGAKFRLRLTDAINFDLVPPYDEDLLASRLAHFSSVGGSETVYSKIVSKNQTQKRSDNQFLTHWYYPYKGKYHPRLVRSIFNIIRLDSGKTVLDPFIGSGTTALEAHLLGINCVGVDISPVCVLISNVKVNVGKVSGLLSRYKDQATTTMRSDFERWEKHANDSKLFQDTGGRNYEKFLSAIKNRDVRDFYQLAQLIFASDRGRRGRDFSAFSKNVDTMIASAHDLTEVEAWLSLNERRPTMDIRNGDARELDLPDNSVDAIVTSPPYSIALNYMDNDQDALRELGVDKGKLSAQCIGVKGKGLSKLELYEEDMRRSYTEMYRVLKKGSFCVVVIGEATYDGEITKTVENAVSFCTETLGFELKYDMPKKIFGLYNTIKDERVLFLRK